MLTRTPPQPQPQMLHLAKHLAAPKAPDKTGGGLRWRPMSDNHKELALLVLHATRTCPELSHTKMMGLRGCDTRGKLK